MINDLLKIQVLECSKGKWQYQIAKDLVENEDGIINPCYFLQGKAFRSYSHYKNSMYNLFERIEKLSFVDKIKII